MMMAVKPCSVVLFRNFLDSAGSLKLNNFPADISYKVSTSEVRDKRNTIGNKKEKVKNSSVETYNPQAKKRNGTLRNKKEVYYSEIQNSAGEISESESSDDSSSSNEEIGQNKIKKKNELGLTKTEKANYLKCVRCDKSFSKYPSYLIHKRSHQLYQFKCILCITTYKDRQSYILHMKRFHPEVEPFVCDYRDCLQSFKTQHLLKSHVKSHLKYMCKFCNKLYAKKHRMRKHVLEYHS